MRRWALVAGLAMGAFALALDLSRGPSRQVSARVLSGGIGLYQKTLSPAAATVGVRCRFEPTCSHYAKAAIAADGALVGTGRAVWRIARCGPWTAAGTVDPP